MRRFDDADDLPRPAQRDVVVARSVRAQYQPPGPPAQDPSSDEGVHQLARVGAEQGEVGLGQGQLAAAAARWGASTCGLSGSITVASTDWPNSASGWCTR